MSRLCDPIVSFQPVIASGVPYIVACTAQTNAASGNLFVGQLGTEETGRHDRGFVINYGADRSDVITDCKVNKNTQAIAVSGTFGLKVNSIKDQFQEMTVLSTNEMNEAGDILALEWLNPKTLGFAVRRYDNFHDVRISLFAPWQKHVC